MPQPIPGRQTDAHAGPLVVFLIGMRINRLRDVRAWWPVMRAMGPMIRALHRNPESGFLGARTALAGLRSVMLVQYWRDFDSLERYARAPDQRHLPAWQAFNRAARGTNSVGIFHETYCVPAGGHESVYVNMPPFGLGKAVGLIPATGSRATARERLNAEPEG